MADDGRPELGIRASICWHVIQPVFTEILIQADMSIQRGIALSRSKKN